MEDLINRQDALKAIIKRLGIKDESYLLESERVIYQQILAMPNCNTIAEWKEPKNPYDLDGTYCCFCSACGSDAYEQTAYCPNCGAKMKEK